MAPSQAPTAEPSQAPTDTMAPTMTPTSMAPTMTPTVDPEAIDEIMAELMCIAASASKSECKVALPEITGKCKWNKNHDLVDRCQLKVFYGACDSLRNRD